MKAHIWITYFAIGLLLLGGCSRSLYVTQSSFSGMRNDTLFSNKIKKHLFLKGYSQEDTKYSGVFNDTVFKVRKRWFALGRISPNARQIIVIYKVLHLSDGTLIEKSKEIYSLLSFHSWSKIKTVTIDSLGRRKISVEKSSYNLFGKGLPEY